MRKRTKNLVVYNRESRQQKKHKYCKGCVKVSCLFLNRKTASFLFSPRRRKWRNGKIRQRKNVNFKSKKIQKKTNLKFVSSEAKHWSIKTQNAILNPNLLIGWVIEYNTTPLVSNLHIIAHILTHEDCLVSKNFKNCFYMQLNKYFQVLHSQNEAPTSQKHRNTDSDLG